MKLRAVDRDDASRHEMTDRSRRNDVDYNFSPLLLHYNARFLGSLQVCGAKAFGKGSEGDFRSIGDLRAHHRHQHRRAGISIHPSLIIVITGRCAITTVTDQRRHGVRRKCVAALLRTWAYDNTIVRHYGPQWPVSVPTKDANTA